MSESTDPAPPEPQAPASETRHDEPPAKDPLRGSRTSGAWVAVVVASVVLVLLVVFIVQNTQSVEVSYLGWEGTAPLAATLLIAAAAGMLIAILAASLRLLQVRRRVKRDRR
ncbi:lipopolysaccharide assembly protein LapA domain-containing protein [Nocardioides sp. W7]|uniref:lipopolysaccharide assembly protein LapA domain-containing protein n=1 Tax=Nocardioides sp. W7 TaxID=2931390 RepID=UPI001FD4854C|nr:lipopolysaccharide assembly protein LapA domain-containing protein [Nocardioides sp. W7]